MWIRLGLQCDYRLQGENKIQFFILVLIQLIANHFSSLLVHLELQAISLVLIHFSFLKVMTALKMWTTTTKYHTLPGLSRERGTLRKHFPKDKLCRMEFCNITQVHASDKMQKFHVSKTALYFPTTAVENCRQIYTLNVILCSYR